MLPCSDAPLLYQLYHCFVGPALPLLCSTLLCWAPPLLGVALLHWALPLLCSTTWLCWALPLLGSTVLSLTLNKSAQTLLTPRLCMSLSAQLATPQRSPQSSLVALCIWTMP